MIEARFYRDERGIPRVELPERYEVAGYFLEDDVQGDLDWTRDLRRLVAEFRADPGHEEWDGTGNAWTLYLTPEGARIEFSLSDDAEPSLDLSLEEFDELLAGWERLLARPWNSPRRRKRLRHALFPSSGDPGRTGEHAVYQAMVEIRDPDTGDWVRKKASSTFFPDEWSAEQVLDEIGGAFDDAMDNDERRGNRWEGVAPSGVTIRGYLRPDGSIPTAFPVYRGPA